MIFLPPSRTAFRLRHLGYTVHCVCCYGRWKLRGVWMWWLHCSVLGSRDQGYSHHRWWRGEVGERKGREERRSKKKKKRRKSGRKGKADFLLPLFHINNTSVFLAEARCSKYHLRFLYPTSAGLLQVYIWGFGTCIHSVMKSLYCTIWISAKKIFF